MMNMKLIPAIMLCSASLFAEPSFSVHPAQQDEAFIHIDLDKAANMGFFDPVAEDGTGGWADFGPIACMKEIPSGIHKFEDEIIPFKIIDPASNQGKSVVVLNGPNRESTFSDQSRKIEVNRKVNELFFLHACMYPESSSEPTPLIKYRIHYEDGTEHMFICYRGLEVDDWWDPPKRMPRAIRTYREKMTWLMNTPWLNPVPEKRIDWIRMESTGNAIPILVAITGSEVPGPYLTLMNQINGRIQDHPTGTLRIALVQPRKEPDQALNLKNGEAFCRQAKEKKADIVVFPEMYNIGYNGIDFDEPGAVVKWNQMAIGPEDPFVERFRQLAVELDLAILITYLERWEGLPRNTASLIDRHGHIVLTYSKVHTCDFIDAELHTTPGDGFVVADLDTRLGPVAVGAMICYDREHPESARINMLKGAEIILTPNACNLHTMLLKQFQVRAYENAVVTAMANYSNKGTNAFNGHSCVFNVNGEEVLMADERVGVYMAGVELGTLRDFREKTIYGNAFRRPHKYKSMISEEVEQPFVRDNYRGKPFIRTER
jgi:N-carbamoylputrescine amidase